MVIKSNDAQNGVTADQLEDNEENLNIVSTERHSRGDSHKTSRGFYDTWGMDPMLFIDPDEPKGYTIYAAHRPYTFRFVIDNIAAFDNVSNVTINFIDELKNYTWNRTGTRGNEYSRNGDENFTSSLYEFIPNRWHLDFNIIFNWHGVNTSTEHLCDIKITDNKSVESNTTQWLDYYVIRSVRFTGNLKVNGEFQGALKDEDWVRSNESITWSGIRVIYDSNQNILLSEDQGTIVLYDDDGNSWEDTSEQNQDMSIISISNPDSDLFDQHIINLAGAAKNNLLEQITFTLRVDNNKITFFNANPRSMEWQTSDTVTCTINAADNDTSGVDENSFEFRYLIDGEQDWSIWYIPKINSEGSIIQCYRDVKFAEGDMNQIQWRGKDMVDNEYSYSEEYSIKIDTTELTFRNPTPPLNELQFGTSINCSIEITDSISGVNGSSIEYSVLLDSKDEWSEWRDAGLFESNKTVVAKVQTDFNYGENNYIKWRAKDVAGNGYFESLTHQLSVSHEMPIIFLISPISGALVNNTKPTLQWNDSYEILLETTYILEYWAENDSANRYSINLTETQYTFKEPLKFGIKYYWHVVPETQDQIGISESGIWNFTINAYTNIFPEYKFELKLLSDEYSRIKTDEVKEIEMAIYNKGNKDDTYHVEVIINLSWERHVDFAPEVFIPAGGTGQVTFKIQVPKNFTYTRYPMKIKIISNAAKELDQAFEEEILIYVEVYKEEKPKEPGFENFEELIIIIILIISIVVVVAVIRIKLKYRKFETDFGQKGKEAEVVYSPEFSKAVDRTSKEDVTDKEKKP